MWARPHKHRKADRVCYVFHHFSTSAIDRTRITVAEPGYAWEPMLETDENGLPTWFLFRAIPQRLCAHLHECDHCPYALGVTEFSHGKRPHRRHRPIDPLEIRLRANAKGNAISR